MLRDPKDVLISCLMTYMPLNDFSVDFLDLSHAVERIAVDIEVWHALRGKLPGDAWIELHYEALTANPRQATAELLSALGLDWSDEMLNHAGRPQVVHSPSYAEVNLPIYKYAIGRWENYRDFLEPHLPTLETLSAKLHLG